MQSAFIRHDAFDVPVVYVGPNLFRRGDVEEAKAVVMPSAVNRRLQHLRAPQRQCGRTGERMSGKIAASRPYPNIVAAIQATQK